MFGDMIDFVQMSHQRVLFFSLDEDTGELFMKKGVRTGVYDFSVSVHCKHFRKTVESTVRVEVKEIGDDAVFNSGSLRLTGKVCKNNLNLFI